MLYSLTGLFFARLRFTIIHDGDVHMSVNRHLVYQLNHLLKTRKQVHLMTLQMNLDKHYSNLFQMNALNEDDSSSIYVPIKSLKRAYCYGASVRWIHRLTRFIV